MPKSIFASKTFWTNIILGVAAGASAFGFDLGLDEARVAEIALGVAAFANIILRIITKDPVSVA